MTLPNGAAVQVSSSAITLASRPQGSLEVRSLHRSTGELQTHTLRLPFGIIGRAPQVSVRLDDPSVSQCHAMLQLVDGVPYCLDLGSRTGVLWDDGDKGRGWIRPDQTVRIGMFDIQVLSGDTALNLDQLNSNPEPQLTTLDVYLPTGATGSFVLENPVTLLGRHPNCGLHFLDEEVAYFQCAFVKMQQGVWCVDMLSKKGTPLNGRHVRVALLREGDLIELGKLSLVYHVGPQQNAPLVPRSGAGSGELMFGSRGSGLEAMIAPLRDVMEQFQQSFMMMTRMFTTMQQEHTAMMCEQMRQIQELIRQTRLPSADIPPTPSVPALNAAPAAAPTPQSETKGPTPTPIDPAEAKILADAHTRFLDRLKQNGSLASKNSNRK